MSDKTWTVTYEGEELTLNTEQYTTLKRLAWDDPMAARVMALDLLRKQHGTR